VDIHVLLDSAFFGDSEDPGALVVIERLKELGLLVPYEGFHMGGCLILERTSVALGRQGIVPVLGDEIELIEEGADGLICVTVEDRKYARPIDGGDYVLQVFVTVELY
jgi:hypothetical protein